MEWPALGGVDMAMLLMLALSVVIGLVRGFTFEVMSLLGWFVAWVAATWAGPELAPHLPVGESGSLLNRGVAFACAFLAVLVVWSLLARGAKALIGATPLQPVDRLMGGLFGVLRGAVVLLVLATLVAYTPLATSPAWRASQGAAWLGAVLRELAPYLPGEVLPPVKKTIEMKLSRT